MRIEEIFESPDFGYKNFVNRDADIAKLTWNVEFEKDDDGKIESIIARVLSNIGDLPTGLTSSGGKQREGIIIARRDGDRLQITRSQLTHYTQGFTWSSTGLGQMLYDRIISEAKKAGFRYLISDYKLSVDARKAWKKLATRYPVTKEVELYDGEKYSCFQIDLNKVVLKESPDFGYTKYQNKESNLKKIEFKEVPSKYGYTINAFFNRKLVGYINILAHNVARVAFSKIDSSWKGTGLGQMLYDRAILAAKNRGLKKFQSDTSLSGDARNAWARLSGRYYVEHIENNGLDYFIVDLRKV